jgi:hypothetical protein
MKIRKITFIRSFLGPRRISHVLGAFALMGALALSSSVFAQVPRIDSVTPGFGHVGDPITIAGANFSPTPADNIVYFGAVRAAVTAASPNSLTVAVPSGATYAPVTVTVGGLTAFGNIPFFTQFKHRAHIGLSCFASRIDVPVGPSDPHFCVADLDGDGKPDVVFLQVGGPTGTDTGAFSALRNVSVAGGISVAPFAPQASFATPFNLVGAQMAIGDVDGDGKLDVILADRSGSLVIYRNNSSPGSLAFDLPAIFHLTGRFFPNDDVPWNGNTCLGINDLDGDGKPDILIQGFNEVAVLRNTSMVGVIDASSFAAPVVVEVNSSAAGLAIADLDGDGKPDIAVGDEFLLASIARNVSTVGNIAFEHPVEVDLGAGSGNGGGGDETSLLIADLNSDGKADIVWAGNIVGVGQNHSLMPGPFPPDGSGILEHYWYLSQGSGSLAIVDLDGDGRPDILGGEDQTGLHNLTPNGAQFSTDSFSDGSFSPIGVLAQPTYAHTIIVCDFDGDGQPDLLLHDDVSHSTSLTIFRGACIEVTQITPASASAGGPGFNLRVDGSCFQAGSVVLWNGTARPTTFVNDAQLVASIPASDLASTAGLTSAIMTVQNPDGSVSEPQLFTIKGPFIGAAQSSLIDPHQSQTITSPNFGTPLTGAGDAALSAIVHNDYDIPAAAIAATYTGNPTGSPVFDVGGGFLDLKLIPINEANFMSFPGLATVSFYYPTTVGGAAESALTLQYFNPATATWQEVVGSGGVAPAKDTTDNLDGTVSGGRFTVALDYYTSTPKIPELTGTVFTMAPPDTTPPIMRCPANIVASTDLGLCSAVVHYTVTAMANPGGATVVSTPPPGTAFPKGTTTVNCTATDVSGNQSSCSFTVTVNDTQAPSIACPGNISVGCSIGLVAPVTFAASATDNCDPSPLVTYSIAPGSGFPVGTTPVTCTATDSSGNHSSCTFNVTRAALGFTGFLSPIGGADATGGSFSQPIGTFKGKSTIPLKFTASRGGSAVVTGIHRLQVIKYTDQTTAGDPIDATPTDAATTGDEFQLTGSEWHFNLDTKVTGMTTGIWLLQATLSDGSQHSAWIQIK